jgi:hypothetical protein
MIESHVYQREKTRKDGVAHAQRANQLDVDIYLPPVFFRPSVMNYLRTKLDFGLSRAVEEAGSTMSAIKKDDWRFMPLAEAPPCLACGWCVENI